MLPRPVNDGNRHLPEDIAPLPPAVELLEAVGTHDPDERDPRLPGPHEPQGCRREASAQAGFKTRYDNTRIPRKGPAFDQTVAEGCQMSLGLEGIARCYDPPDPVEAKPGEGNPADEHVCRVRWVERPPQESDALTRQGQRQSYANGAEGHRGRFAHLSLSIVQRHFGSRPATAQSI